MKKSTQIAEDIYKKTGALLSISDIMEYCGIGRETARVMVKGLAKINPSVKKCYWYQDVAEVLSKRIALWGANA